MPRCASVLDPIGTPIALAPPRRLPAPLARSRRQPAVLPSVRRPGIDWFELLILVAFAAMSAWVLALELTRVGSQSALWNGTTSPYPIDQLQYLSWIKDASRHVLASNLFVLHGTPHDYLEPMVLASAGLVALGTAPAIALLVWQPVAIALVFGTVRALVRRQLWRRSHVRMVLCLALFAGLPSIYVDVWLPFWSWGYQVALLALACSLGSLLIYDRGRRSGWSVWLAAPLGALASWLHPWQGEVLVLIVAGAEVAMWIQGQRPRVLRPLLLIGVSILPLVYYVILQRVDPSWRLGQLEASGSPSLNTVLLPIGLLALPALLAYRLRPLTFVQAATRVWPFAALAVFLLSRAGLGSSPMHAFLGISVPLAILGVQGVASLRSRRVVAPRSPWLTPVRVRRSRPRQLALVGLAAVVVLGLTVPVAVSKFSLAHRLVREMKPIRSNEQLALDYLAHDPQHGGVLTGIHLGALVPMDTGRHTYIGDCYWSLPNCESRNTDAWWLLNWARLPPRIADAFVLSTGARFVLKDCREKPRVWHEIRSIVVGTHRFGCATVYEVAGSGAAAF